MTNVTQTPTSDTIITCTQSSTATTSSKSATSQLSANITNSNLSISALIQTNIDHHQTSGSGSGHAAAGGSTSHSSGSGTSSAAGNQEPCLICGDVASGKHYGLRSCEACKAFFKRTVQGKIEYSCPATRECEINKRRRKACQACRFQKCLNMGMLKEGVRLDRVRGGRQKYKRGTSPLPDATGAGCPSTSSLNNSSSPASAMSSSNTNNNNNNNNINNNGSSHNHSNILDINGPSSAASLGAFPTIAATHQQTAIGTGETNKIMTALINCEPEELTATPSQYISTIPSNLNVQLKTLHILGDLFDRELVSLIGWAKQIPGFSETITLNDQMRLLQSTWAEVIALSIGYRSHLKRIECYKQLGGTTGGPTTPSPTSSSPASTTSSSYNNNNSNSLYNLENVEIRLVFAKDLIIDFKHAILCGAEEIFYNCVQLIKRLDHLRISPKEYILLKAISLTNADVRLENPKATFRLRDLVMDALYEVTLSTVKQGTSLNNRMNQVLLCLPVLRQIDSSIRKFWNDIRKGPNNVPMNKLFEEMLEPCQRMYRSSVEM